MKYSSMVKKATLLNYGSEDDGGFDPGPIEWLFEKGEECCGDDMPVQSLNSDTCSLHAATRIKRIAKGTVAEVPAHSRLNDA